MAVSRTTVFRTLFKVFVISQWIGNGVSQRAPEMQVIEIVPSFDNSTTAETVRFLDKPKNSEIVVGQDTTTNSRLVLKCTADYPVQFIYIGSGRPELSTYTNEWEGSEKSHRFEAGVSLGLIGFHQVLREEDSGNYTCISVDDQRVLSYYYIFVPGPSIFLPPDGYDTEILFGSKDKDVKIPCAVAHPNATVQLFRTANGKLTCPALEGKRASYDPKKGFNLKLKDLKPPEGTYVCVASYLDQFRMIEYQLVMSKYPQGPCRNSPCGNKAECDVVDGYPVCYCFRGLSGNPYNGCQADNKNHCYTSSQCAKGSFCSQGKCTKDPCNPSPCGKGSQCQSVQGRASCSCLEGYSGKVPYCRKKCFADLECPEDEMCSGNVCQSPCSGHCGKNADCKVVVSGKRKRPECSCPPGFSGNPLQECRRSQCLVDEDCAFNSYCSRGKCIPAAPEPTCPTECGLNAECVGSNKKRKYSCQCLPGHTGDPLTECFENCPASAKKRCGMGSICRVVTTFGRADDEFECFCPSGTSTVFIDSQITCVNDSLIPDSGDCDYNNPCPPSASCRLSRRSQGPECYCPVGSTGDPYNQCYITKCPPGTCGIGARCSVTLGDAPQPSYECSCPPGKTGNPYELCTTDTIFEICPRNGCSPGQACSLNLRTGDQECSSCPPGTRANRDGICFGKCSPQYKCGTNAGCRTTIEAGRTIPQCFCPVGTAGNPEVACSRITPIPPPVVPDLCYRNNICPPGSNCTMTRQGEVACICPKGFRGSPPNCRPIDKPCREDPDCDIDEECLGGLCISQCGAECGRFGTCERRGRSIKCICFTGYRINSDGVCTPEGLIDLCSGFRCGDFASCSVVRGVRRCTCPLGYEGDPFVRCFPERFSSRPRPPPIQTPYPIDSRPPQFNGDDNFRPFNPDSVIITAPDRSQSRADQRSRDECDPRYGSVGGITYQCERGLQCQRDRDGVSRCLPVRRNSCQTNIDCLEPEVCRNSTCFDPCHPENSPCASVAYSECRVIEGRALCACQRGFVGSPLSGLGCTPERPLALNEDGGGSDPVTLCDMTQVGTPGGCDNPGECQIVNDKPICVCGKELEGIYPDCQSKCRLDLDCPEGQACMNFKCTSPCELPNVCGSNAQCRVEDHRSVCECQDGFVGDARVGCYPKNNVRQGITASAPVNCTGNRCSFF